MFKSIMPAGLHLVVLAALAACASVRSPEAPRPALIPMPQRIAWEPGCFAIGEGALLAIGEGASPATARAVREWLASLGGGGGGEAGGSSSGRFVPGGPALPRSKSPPPASARGPGDAEQGGDAAESGRILFRTGAVDVPCGMEECYRLDVTPSRITVTAPADAGFFYALQTLKQLAVRRDGGKGGAEGAVVPCCRIADWPAFRVRGFMHDVGRNFQTLSFLKEQMEVLAAYKMNVFHMHLTDRPGFRVESEKYPELDKAENMRPTRKPGSFYRRDELKDFVAFCRDRHITVIPELDMPGHSDYFKKTFGFAMQTPRGVAVLTGLIGEWCSVFDGPFFHVGSDEVRIAMKDFVPKMVAAVRSHGREAVMWRPGGRVPDGGVITQLWSRRGGPLPGVRFIDSRANYVNHLDPLIAPIRLFFQQPCRRPRGDGLALGGVLCYWPDTRVDDERKGLAIGPVYPAIVTYAESIWRGVARDRPEYRAKLPARGTPEFAAFKAFEDRLIEHRDRFFRGKPFGYVRQTNVPWKLIGPFPGPSGRAFGPEKEIRESYVVDGAVFRWRDAVAWGGTIHIRHFFGFPGHIPGAKSGTVYGLTYIHSDEEREGFMWIGFDTLSLSGGRRPPGNPPQGLWSAAGGNVWLNGGRIDPPLWDHPGLSGAGSAEVAITDEVYVAREPARVHFRRGWNELLVKAPDARADGRRTWKWCFTALPVSWDGKRAAEPEGLRFSTRPGG